MIDGNENDRVMMLNWRRNMTFGKRDRQRGLATTGPQDSGSVHKKTLKHRNYKGKQYSYTKTN